MEVFSPLQRDYFHDSPLLDYQSLRNLDLLNGWIVCINKLVKFVFFKKVLVRMFFMKKYFSAENVFIFQISLQVTVFFISIVFFFLRGGGVEKEETLQKGIVAFMASRFSPHLSLFKPFHSQVKSTQKSHLTDSG